MSHKTTITSLDKLGEGHDAEVLKWKDAILSHMEGSDQAPALEAHVSCDQSIKINHSCLYCFVCLIYRPLSRSQGKSQNELRVILMKIINLSRLNH